MKRILLLISIIALAYNAFSQLNIDRFKSNKYNSSVSYFIDNIIEDNPQVVDYDVMEYEFSHGRIIEAYIFFDKNNNLLDLIIFNKNFNHLYEIISYRKLFWDRQRFISSIQTDNNSFKLLMSDGTYITVEFDFVKHTNINSDGKKYCIETYYSCLVEDHINPASYLFAGYDSDYEYVDCD